jgi:hypothetical protein
MDENANCIREIRMGFSQIAYGIAGTLQGLEWLPGIPDVPITPAGGHMEFKRTWLCRRNGKDDKRRAECEDKCRPTKCCEAHGWLPFYSESEEVVAQAR